MNAKEFFEDIKSKYIQKYQKYIGKYVRFKGIRQDLLIKKDVYGKVQEVLERTFEKEDYKIDFYISIAFSFILNLGELEEGKIQENVILKTHICLDKEKKNVITDEGEIYEDEDKINILQQLEEKINQRNKIQKEIIDITNILKEKEN